MSEVFGPKTLEDAYWGQKGQNLRDTLTNAQKVLSETGKNIIEAPDTFRSANLIGTTSNFLGKSITSNMKKYAFGIITLFLVAMIVIGAKFTQPQVTATATENQATCQTKLTHLTTGTIVMSFLLVVLMGIFSKSFYIFFGGLLPLISFTCSMYGFNQTNGSGWSNYYVGPIVLGLIMMAYLALVYFAKV